MSADPKRIRKGEPRHSPADCGKRYRHDPHGYLTPRGKVKACDGMVNKRRRQ